MSFSDLHLHLKKLNPNACHVLDSCARCFFIKYITIHFPHLSADNSIIYAALFQHK